MGKGLSEPYIGMLLKADFKEMQRMAYVGRAASSTVVSGKMGSNALALQLQSAAQQIGVYK